MALTEPYSINTPEGMAAAVKWTTEHVAKIKQGGVWIVPRSGTIIIIDHDSKTATFTELLIGETAVKKVFHEMGWKVKEGR